MRKPFFTGACTALVTPFCEGKIHSSMLEILLERQIRAGIRTVVICGTTGEASTLSDAEKIELFRTAKKYTGDRCKIIAGTGSNDTAHSINLSLEAEKCGADGLLVVSPYYNKATPEGLYLHYSTIAQAVHIPLILYNVPSRTGVDIPVEIYRRLAEIPNIVGVKEASTDICKIGKIRQLCPLDFSVWAGNDDHIIPMMAMGAQGVVSVASNVVPVEIQTMAQAALAGDFDTGASLQIQFLPLIESLFSEVNPIPVKEAMRILGYDCGECRLPLCQMSTPNRAKLMNRIKEFAIL